MTSSHSTVLEINLKALELNYQFLTAQLQPNTRFLAVVKANSYGSDAIIISKKLEQLGVDYLAVAYTQEGISLRKNGIKKPILVLHPQTENLSQLIDFNLEPNLYSFGILKSFISVATEKNVFDYPVHIKFNTGLNRLGFQERDIDDINRLINQTIKPVSVFSHLAASEDTNEINFTHLQINRFNQIIKKISSTFSSQPFFHLCNTSGLLHYPEAHLDMVRSGIGLYGFSNIPKFQKQLQPIATLKSVISQIHLLSKGESVGYNRAYIAKQNNEKIAVIPIGHADGINRMYGNGKGWVTINGKKAAITGNVCMDMIMVNVTAISCDEGDEVIVFGQHPTAEELSASVNSISYELITGISPRIKRLFIEK